MSYTIDSSAMSHLNSPDSNPLHNKSDKGIKIQNKSITKLIELVLHMLKILSEF